MKGTEVLVEICRKGVTLPEYKNEWDAGMDVCSAEEVIIGPGETIVIPTGVITTYSIHYTKLYDLAIKAAPYAPITS